MALREHMRNVDSLITLQDSRLQTLEVNFEEDLEALENEFAVEREQIDTQVAREREGDLASPCHHTCAQPSAHWVACLCMNSTLRTARSCRI